MSSMLTNLLQRSKQWVKSQIFPKEISSMITQISKLLNQKKQMKERIQDKKIRKVKILSIYFKSQNLRNSKQKATKNKAIQFCQNLRIQITQFCTQYTNQIQKSWRRSRVRILRRVWIEPNQILELKTTKSVSQPSIQVHNKSLVTTKVTLQ